MNVVLINPWLSKTSTALNDFNIKVCFQWVYVCHHEVCVSAYLSIISGSVYQIGLNNCLLPTTLSAFSMILYPVCLCPALRYFHPSRHS